MDTRARIHLDGRCHGRMSKEGKVTALTSEKCAISVQRRAVGAEGVSVSMVGTKHYVTDGMVGDAGVEPAPGVL